MFNSQWRGSRLPAPSEMPNKATIDDAVGFNPEKSDFYVQRPTTGHRHCPARKWLLTAPLWSRRVSLANPGLPRLVLLFDASYHIDSITAVFRRQFRYQIMENCVHARHGGYAWSRSRSNRVFELAASLPIRWRLFFGRHTCAMLFRARCAAVWRSGSDEVYGRIDPSPVLRVFEPVG